MKKPTIDQSLFFLVRLVVLPLSLWSRRLISEGERVAGSALDQ